MNFYKGNQLESKGYFWIPDKEEKKLPGFLKYSETDGTSLDLFGIFDELKPDNKANNIILGTLANGRKVTMLDCFCVNKTTSFPGFETSCLSGIHLFIGKHFESVTEFQFDRLSVNYDAIYNWLGLKTIRLSSDFDDMQKLLIKLSLPETISMKLDSMWSLEFNFSFLSEKNYETMHKVNIQQSTDVVFRSNSLKSFRDFREKFHIFNSFLTIAFWGYPAFQNAQFFVDADATTVEWLSLVSPKKPKSFRGNLDYLLLYTDLTNNANKIIGNWFAFYKDLSSIVNTVSELFINRQSAIEYQFLGAVNAMEAFYRKVLRGNEKLEVMLNAVLDYIPESVVKAIVIDKKEFSEVLVKTRHYFVHDLEKFKSKSASISELFYLREKIKIILIAGLLKNAGMEEEELTEVLSTRGQYLFNHLLLDID